jgi:hypothetical protein
MFTSVCGAFSCALELGPQLFQEGSSAMDHLNAFSTRSEQKESTVSEDDRCALFVATLSAPVVAWYDRLPNSVKFNFTKLSHQFLTQFPDHEIQGTPTHYPLCMHAQLFGSHHVCMLLVIKLGSAFIIMKEELEGQHASSDRACAYDLMPGSLTFLADSQLPMFSSGDDAASFLDTYESYGTRLNWSDAVKINNLPTTIKSSTFPPFKVAAEEDATDCKSAVAAIEKKSKLYARFVKENSFEEDKMDDTEDDLVQLRSQVATGMIHDTHAPVHTSSTLRAPPTCM